MKEFFSQYKYTIIGGLVGLIFALLIFAIGFFKSLLFLIIVSIGMFFGYARDKKTDVKNYFDDFWSKKDWK